MLRKGQDPGVTKLGVQEHVALPSRLGDRAGRIWPLKTNLEIAEFESALTWEIAAVCSGLTLTEWAFREALTSGMAQDVATGPRQRA
jgi:hypothetical protein